MTPIVVVHGLYMPGSELFLLRRRLTRAGFAATQFRYRTIIQNVDRSAAALAEYVAATPGDTVHFVGHSLGGIVILKMIEHYGVERIGRIVSLGSPFRGSISANNLRRLPGGKCLLGRAMAQANEEAAERTWSGARELGVIAGDHARGMGRVIGVLPKPNDGTVTVDETRLPGATDHIVLPVTHLSMLWSADVAEQVIAFLRDGHFTR
ncbi:MAG: alpha/beta hydrolase [Gammaproteobacteria bacterium]|nr:alpha/beta hydrolase [Gammaproteobacteria bacterium]